MIFIQIYNHDLNQIRFQLKRLHWRVRLYLFRQGYTVPNPILTTVNQGDVQYSYQPSYQAGYTTTSEVRNTYGNPTGSYAIGTTGYGVVGAGNTSSTVRGTTVEQYAPAPKITFGHPTGAAVSTTGGVSTGGYIATNTS